MLEFFFYLGYALIICSISLLQVLWFFYFWFYHYFLFLEIACPLFLCSAFRRFQADLLTLIK